MFPFSCPFAKREIRKAARWAAENQQRAGSPAGKN
jgi:hypothetical protein